MSNCLSGCLPGRVLPASSSSVLAPAASAAAPAVSTETVTCPYGKASVVFPLSVPAGAALGLLKAAESAATWRAQVMGYTTPLTTEAGACSVRFMLEGGATGLPAGNYAVALQAPGRTGWLPGLGNTKCLKDGSLGLEVVVLGRADASFTNVMYLSEKTLTALWPCEQGAGHGFVRVVQPLLMKQLADCPGQWLRDRLLKLSSCVEEKYEEQPRLAVPLKEALCSAGLVFASMASSATVLPADTGKRINTEELGYWQEEADIGHRCAGSMEGTQRLDVPDDIIASML